MKNLVLSLLAAAAVAHKNHGPTFALRSDIAIDEHGNHYHVVHPEGYEPENVIVVDVNLLPVLKQGMNFVAGVVWGLVTYNNLSEMEECFLELSDQYGFLRNTFWDDFIQNHEWGRVILSWMRQEEEMCDYTWKACDSTPDEIFAIADWAEIFFDRKELIKVATKHFLFHKKEILEDVQIAKNQIKLHEFFQAGWTTGDILTLLVGPIEVSDEPRDVGI